MFDLKKFLDASISQINPFDGGKNFQSVMAQKKPAVASTAQAVKPQSRPVATTSSPMPKFQQSNLNNAISQMAGINKFAPKPIQSQIAPGNALTNNPIYATLEALPLGPVSEALKFGDPQFQEGPKAPTTKQFVKKIAQSGYANSPLGAAEQVFGGLANEATKRMGLNDGYGTETLSGPTSAFSNQVADNGLGNTLLTNAMNIAGAVGAHEAAPHLPQAPGNYLRAETNGLVARNAPTIADASVHLAQNPSLTALGAAHPQMVGVPGVEYVAGKKAAGFDKATKKGITYESVDGADKYKVSNHDAKLNAEAANGLHAGQPTTIQDVIKQKSFAKDYKRDTFNPAVIPEELPGDQTAVTRKNPDGTISIHVDMKKLNDPQELGKVLLEERQHAVQYHEGHATGTVETPWLDAVLQHGSPELKSVDGKYREVKALVGAQEKMFGEMRSKLDQNDPKFAKKLKALHNQFDTKDNYEMQQHLEQLRLQRRELLAREGDNPAAMQEHNKYANSFGEAEAKNDAASTLSQKELDKKAKSGDFDVYENVHPDVAVIDRGGNVSANEGSKPKPVDKPKIVKNKFTESVKKSDEVSSEVKKMVSGQHVERSTKDLVDKVHAEIKYNLDKTTSNVLKELSVESGKASDTSLARAIEVAKAQDALGTVEGKDIAASLYDQISEHGVNAGRAVQILSLIAKRSPEGLRNLSFRQLKKAGVELTPKIQTEIQGHIDAIKAMPDGKPKDFAIAVLQKAVKKHIPASKVDNIMSVWKAGLLSGIKTQQGNAISNSIFGGLKKVSDVPATLADMGMSLKTGERQKTLTSRGIASGTAEGVHGGITTMKTGIDIRSIGDKYDQHGEINFKNKYIQKIFGDPSNFVFRGMGAADQPFYYAAFKNSLYDTAKANGINKGLRGGALSRHMDELVASPTENMVDIAAKEAEKAVLGFDTAASELIANARRGVDNSKKLSPLAKKTANTLLNALAPFVRVPSAFLSRTVDFTPYGVAKEVFEQVAKKEFNQRSMAQAIGEGMTGTGIIALGVAMSNSGMLSGTYPKDPKQQARWKAEGITPNSIKIGDKWWSLNYGGPLGMLLNAGNRIAIAGRTGEGNGLASASIGLVQDLTGQSFLQGMSGLNDAINNPDQKAKTFLNSQIASLIPNWSNDAANLFDPKQRQTNTLTQAVQAKIPGLRNMLPVKTDSLGNELSQASGGGLWTLLGVKPSKVIDDPMFQEINRLNETSNLVFPTSQKTIGQGKNAIKLSPEQVTARQKLVGDKLKPLWNDIMKSDEYKKMDDEHKALALTKALTDVNTAVNKQIKAGGLGDLANGYLKSGPVTDGETGLLHTLSTYASAFGTSPGEALNDVLHGQTILRIVGGGLIVQRADMSDTQKLIATRGGNVQNGVKMQLDHVVPLQLGGTNAISNLKLITEKQDKANNAAENFLGTQLKNGAIDMKTAQKLMKDYKDGALTGDALFTQAKGKGNNKIGNALIESTPTSTTTPTTKTASNYTKGKTPTDPAGRYEAHLAAYEQNKKDGKLTSVKDFSTRQSLAKEAITSKYSQEVQDFYGMSKTEQSAYFAQDRDKATALYNEAKKLDSELNTSKFTATPKYKYGLGSKPKKATVAKIPGVKKGSLNYASRLSTTSKSSASSYSALRKLVQGSKMSTKTTKPKLKTVAYKKSTVRTKTA